MKILVADDDRGAILLIEDVLKGLGYETLPVTDGIQAWDWMQKEGAPPLAILDWMMPGVDGFEICRRVRASAQIKFQPYIIILTATGRKEGKTAVIRGLEAGANDYITKPFDPGELRARVEVGRRVLALQTELADRVRELETALGEVRALKKIIPVCAYCRKIRDDDRFWHEMEAYLKKEAGVDTSHGICPECLEKERAANRARKNQGTV